MSVSSSSTSFFSPAAATLRSTPKRKLGGGRPSLPITSYFRRLDEMANKSHHFAVCKLCEKGAASGDNIPLQKIVGRTDNYARHLNKCKYYADIGDDDDRESKRMAIVSSPPVKSSVGLAKYFEAAYDADRKAKLHQLVLEAFADNAISHRVVDSLSFQRMIHYISPSAGNALPNRNLLSTTHYNASVLFLLF